jgi:hypothetical protein
MLMLKEAKNFRLKSPSISTDLFFIHIQIRFELAHATLLALVNAE